LCRLNKLDIDSESLLNGLENYPAPLLLSVGLGARILNIFGVRNHDSFE
jgi:hypothetical protein